MSVVSGKHMLKGLILCLSTDEWGICSYIINIIIHHHVHEGLGVFPVP
jgi:hypothetical protein